MMPPSSSLKSSPMLRFVKIFTYMVFSLAFLGGHDLKMTDRQARKTFFMVLGMVALVAAAIVL